jgi:hypothetical protein
MRRPLTAPNQRDIAEREPSRLLEPAERNVLDEREDVALEGGEVDELAVLFVPLAYLALGRRRWRSSTVISLVRLGLADVESARQLTGDSRAAFRTANALAIAVSLCRA